MPKKELNIIEFISELNLLDGSELSLAQATILKATYGLALNPAELEIYQRATGRETYEPREHTEATIVAGRQGGKTSQVGANISVYEAFRHKLKRGEHAHVLLIAPAMYQAQIAFGFIRNYILASPVLKAKVAKIRKSQIVLHNGITIACYPCSQITIRGLRVVAAVLDEVGFWRDEATAANPAEDVLNALRPAMATIPNHKLIKISTPYRKEGVLWRDYNERGERDFLVWQLTTAEMNPTISSHFLEKERRRDEESFRREYLAEFTDQIERWIPCEILEQCVMKSSTELPSVTNGNYAAAVDLAFKRDDFALAIAHRSSDGTIILDYTATWTGTPKAPLGYEWVCAEIKRIMKQYGLNTLVGDQYCAAIIQQEFLKLGICYEEKTFGAGTRLELFGNLKHLLIQRRIQILDKPELLQQLRALEQHKGSRGNVEIRSAYHVKDDLAVAVALVALQLSNGDAGPNIFELGRVPRPWDPLVGTFSYNTPTFRGGDLNPGSCCWQAICKGFPFCLDEGGCLR